MEGQKRIQKMFKDLGLEPAQLEVEKDTKLQHDEQSEAPTECLFFRTGNSTTGPSKEDDSAGLA